MTRLVCVIAVLAGITTAVGAAAPQSPLAQPRTLLATESRITQFAQDGGWVAWTTALKGCKRRLHFRSLRAATRARADYAASPVGCSDGRFVLGGSRAAWTTIVGAGNTELDYGIYTATANAPRPRRARLMAFLGAPEDALAAAPPIAGRGNVIVYYRREDGVLAPSGRSVERLLGARPARVFRIDDPVALAVDQGRIAAVQRKLVRGDACGCNFEPAWSPDGTRIAFLSGEVCCVDSQATADVYVMSAEGGGRTRVTSDGRPKAGVAWSPDGKQLAYGYDNPRSGWTVAVVNIDGGSPRDVAAGQNPTWSADGRELALDHAGQIQVVGVDGSGLRTLAPGTNPSWSPDGSRIAYETSTGVATVRPDGSDRRIGGILEKSPAWSPDGRLLAGEVRSTKLRGLWVVPVADPSFGGAYHVAGTSGLDRNPSWSADGTRLVFDSLRNDLVRGARPRPELYTIEVAGGPVRPLAYTQGDEWASAVQVRSKVGRLLSTYTARGAPLGLAMTGRYVVVMTRDPHTGARAFDVADAGTGRLIRRIDLGWGEAFTNFSASGGHLAYAVNDTIRVLDLRSGTRRLAARGRPVGLFLAGNRLYWADNVAGRTGALSGRIRTLLLPR